MYKIDPLTLHFYAPGTDPLDVAVELNREHGFEMLVWNGYRFYLMDLHTDDCWSYAHYTSSLWPDGCGRDFASHWRFAILPSALEL